MAAEGAEIKDEQIPPQEEGGDDEVRETSGAAVIAAQQSFAPRPKLSRPFC